MTATTSLPDLESEGLKLDLFPVRVCSRRAYGVDMHTVLTADISRAWHVPEACTKKRI